jgi:drug/metabolite transporter (DMT)-like permease
MDVSPPHPHAKRTALAFATCTLIWGSTFLFIRIGNDAMPPMWAATLRLALAAVVLTALAAITGQGLPTGAARRAAAAYGLFQFGLNFPLLYYGETVVSSGLAAVVFATIPITSAFIARMFGLERLDAVKLGAACVALGGVVVLFAHDLTHRVTALPLLAIYLATILAAFGSVMLKRGPRQPPIGANAIGAIVGTPVCLVVSLLAREPHPLPVHGAQIVPILYLAIAGSVGAFVVFSWLVQRMPVSTVSFIGVVVPVFALALGALVRHERLERGHVIGSALVIAGVLLAMAGDRRRARARAASILAQAPSSATE